MIYYNQFINFIKGGLFLMKAVKKIMMGLSAMAICASMLATQVFATSEANLARHNSIGLHSQTEFSSWYAGGESSDSGFMDTEISVNHFSGNVTINTKVTQGSFLELEFTYNSLDSVGSQELGEHFATNFNRTLTPMSEDVYEYRDTTGTRYHFEQEQGMLRDEKGRGLAFDQEGYPYKIQDSLYQLIYFREDGKFVKQIESHHGGMSYITTDATYNEDGTLNSVANDNYQYDFSYGSNDRIQKAYFYDINVGDNEATELECVYDQAADKLTGIRLDGMETIFAYDDEGEYIVNIGDFSIEYDSQGRATKVTQYDEDGNVIDEESYLYGNNQTAIIDEEGEITLEVFNPDGTLVK